MPATAAIDNETLDHLLSVVAREGSNIGAWQGLGRVLPCNQGKHGAVAKAAAA